MAFLPLIKDAANREKHFHNFVCVKPQPVLMDQASGTVSNDKAATAKSQSIQALRLPSSQP